MPARLLMIALDGADGALLDRWSADGTLPHLTSLRARGASSRLTSPEGITDDALWASFQYASDLGEHGRYHWRQRLNSGEMGFSYLNETGRESFWDSLSNQGLRVAIFDVPKCGLPRSLNGIHLVDWLVHGRYFDEPKSYPDSLAGEIVAKFGPAPPSRCAYEGPPLSDDAVREVTTHLRTSVAQKRAAGLHYLQSESWDLFVIGFKEAHCAGHHFWDLADPRHPDHDPARTARLADPFRTIMLDLDTSVGDLIAAAGPDAAIAVFSTSDMEPNGTLVHLMPGIVKRMNQSLGDSFPARAFRHAMKRLRLPLLIKPPCEILPYNENCAALRVKTPAMMNRIESLLCELTDADTGQLVIAAIDRPSASQTGKRAAALPDLLIRYTPGTFPRAVVSPQLGRIEANRPQVRPGNHAAGGFLISTSSAFSAVTAMQDFGPIAAELLQVTPK